MQENLDKIAAGTDETGEQTILHLYQLGIESCQNKDRERFERVVSALIEALSFDYQEMAESFQNLYRFSLKMVEQEMYDQALLIFKELHQVWQTAFLHEPKVRGEGNGS